MSLQEKIRFICSGLPLSPLPDQKSTQDVSVPHGPVRTPGLNKGEMKVDSAIILIKEPN